MYIITSIKTFQVSIWCCQSHVVIEAVNVLSRILKIMVETFSDDFALAPEIKVNWESSLA